MLELLPSVTPLLLLGAVALSVFVTRVAAPSILTCMHALVSLLRAMLNVFLGISAQPRHSATVAAILVATGMLHHVSFSLQCSQLVMFLPSCCVAASATNLEASVSYGECFRRTRDALRTSR